jgi:hypothetical protein
MDDKVFLEAAYSQMSAALLTFKGCLLRCPEAD